MAVSRLGVVTLALLSMAVSFVEARQQNAGSAHSESAEVSLLGERSLLNINNLSMWFRRDGWSARHPLRVNFSGVTFPRSTDQVVYQDGLVWGGRVMDGDPQEIRVGGQTFEIGTVPGAITIQGVPEDPNDPGVRIFRVRGDYATADLQLDTAELLDRPLSQVSDDEVALVRAQYAADWREWPWRKGAPFLDRDGDGSYDPAIDEPSFRNVDCTEAPDPCENNADQIAWLVVNDLNRGATSSLYGSKSIGLEMQLTLWAYARTNALGDAIFKRYKLHYKGTAEAADDAVIEDMYLALWSDPDIGDFGDDFAGSDTDLNMGFAYNANPEDDHYRAFGLPPPAVGYDLLQGPTVTDAAGEGVFDFRHQRGIRNLPMTSFVYFAAGSAVDDPQLGRYSGTQEWYNLLRGFQPQPNIVEPVPFTDPNTGEDSAFALDGDPVRGTGWVDGIPLPPGDRRIVMNTGPFSMALNDSQEVVVALLAGLGSDHLRSVDRLKFSNRFIQEAYDGLFQIPAPPAGPKVRSAMGDGAIVLDWGFDPGAMDATENNLASTFIFEGYNLYQFPSLEADISQAVKLATFDLANGITTILGEELDDTSGEVLRLPRQIGTDSGLRWIFRITRDALRTEPLINGQPYYFAVTAYSRNTDPAAIITALESVPRKFSVVPQQAPPGIRRDAEMNEVLPVRQVAGTGDVVVRPVVVDPAAVVDATYTVDFEADTWRLWRGNDVILAGQQNYTLDDGYLAVDGIQVKVGDPVLETPTTFSDATVLVDADQTDGELSFWGDPTLFEEVDGYASTFWEGGGTDDSDLLGRDLEIRFTGISNADGSEIIRGGSIATLGGVQPGSAERSLDTHPFRPSSAPATGPFLQPMPFEVWDVEDPAAPLQLNASIFDRGADGSDNRNSVAYHKTYNMAGRDYITIVATPYDSTAIHTLTDANTTWTVFFRQGGLSTWSTGDVLRIEYASVLNPGEDRFQFTTNAQSYLLEAARMDVKRINVFPNPYYGLNLAETSSHEGFVTFSHLPERVTVRLFDLAGNLVRTLDKNDTDQFLQWDLLNNNELPVASGIFIAHIEMPALKASKILQLAIVQEQQFLENY